MTQPSRRETESRAKSTLVCSVLAATLLVATTVAGAAASKLKRSGIGGICGGFAGFQCKRGLFCDFAPSARCGAADQTGTCARKPQFCTKIYKPVCGCNGKSYGNDCERRAAGVGKVKDGACKAH
jgi:Kazal-type serine protease inhibitor domain